MSMYGCTELYQYFSTPSLLIFMHVCDISAPSLLKQILYFFCVFWFKSILKNINQMNVHFSQFYSRKWMWPLCSFNILNLNNRSNTSTYSEWFKKYGWPFHIATRILLINSPWISSVCFSRKREKDNNGNLSIMSLIRLWNLCESIKKENNQKRDDRSVMNIFSLIKKTQLWNSS